MRKLPKCKGCGETGHYAINCSRTARAPIRSSPRPIKRTPIKRSTAKPKKSTRTKIKEAAWKAFSDYIRTRDSLATTGTIDFCVCITCNERGDNRPKPYAQIQAGHAVGGRGNAVLFHEEIVNGQCSYCNQKPPMGLGGDYGNYAIALIKKYGIEHVQKLQQLKGTTKQYKQKDLEEIEVLYKEKLKQLLR